MSTENTISVWIKTLACFAIVCSLVLFPPSASHAMSGAHNGHHAEAVETVGSHAVHNHDTAAPTFEGGDPLAQADDQTSGQCCSGICVSVALAENATGFIDHVATSTFVISNAQAASIESSGFLRPPQYLI